MRRDQLLLDGHRHGLIKQLFQEPALGKPPLPVLRERGVIPRVCVQIQPDKPSEDQVPGQLTHQGPFRRDAYKIATEQGQEQLLRRNRRAACLRLERFAQLPDPDDVDQRSDLPHGMIRGHKLFQIDVVQHRWLWIGCAHHRRSPPDGNTL